MKNPVEDAWKTSQSLTQQGFVGDFLPFSTFPKERQFWKMIPQPDETAVRTFIAWLHDGAARAFRTAEIEPDQAGWMVVTQHNPFDDRVQVYDRFRIGDADAMATAVLTIAGLGMNPFIEARTVDLARVVKGERGNDDATTGVFALLIDRDHDDGKGGVALDVTPSALIASSAHNRHEWLMLDRAAGIADAKAAGEVLRRASRADSATGKPTQQDSRYCITKGGRSGPKNATGICLEDAANPYTARLRRQFSSIFSLQGKGVLEEGWRHAR